MRLQLWSSGVGGDGELNENDSPLSMEYRSLGTGPNENLLPLAEAGVIALATMALLLWLLLMLMLLLLLLILVLLSVGRHFKAC